MTDFVVSIESSRKKIAKIIDAFYTELEGIVGKASECASTEELWQHRDRVEEIRGAVYKLKKSTSRNTAEAREAYFDSMRADKARGAGDGHYEERLARYEINNISEYKVLTNLERTLEDINNFSYHLDATLRWIKDRFKWMRDDEQWSRMKY